MATISTPTYLDGGTARTAGEAWTLNTGSSLTIRTDTRVHANAPASNTGSLGSVTINEGELIWDSTAIRWMPYDSGTGNVPAIGTSVTQGAVSGYLLGVWSAINVAQTAVGEAMPATGFIKFREVTGGAFAAGALTGIGAAATGPDVQGWMEVVHDAAANITVPRLGKHTVRGGRFFLADTTGVRGQTFQIPTMGSAAQLAPGLFIETGVASDEYEFWPALNGATAANGWSYVHIGNATGTTDARQKFLKATAGGVMTMGETWSVSGTYASIAAQAGTYAGVAHSCTYTWQNDLVEVYYASGHQLETGQQTGLDFTSGGATAYDGIYTVTVTSPYHFTVPLAGSGLAGNVTSRPGITVTFTAHGQHIGEQVYCDFTSGTGVDGAYEIYIVGSANAYTIKYPSAVAVTSGIVFCIHTLQITYTAHGLAQGQTIYCDFTTGTGTNGVYVAKAVATNTININFPHSATTSGNVTISRDLGYVSAAGLRTWIPSTILAECATGARATNTIANATIASRPEWTTTSAGALDIEKLYGTSGYFNVTQPYAVRMRDTVLFDSSVLTECATPLDVDGLYLGMGGGLDAITVNIANCYAGGTVKNVKAHRGNAPSTSDHAVSISYCKGIAFENIQGSIVQYARSSGYPIATATSADCTFTNCGVLNGRLNLSGSPNITVNGLDYCERLNGNGLAAETAVNTDANCNNLKVDGVTYGLNFTVPNQQPNRLLYTIGCANVKLRNCGTLATPLPLPTWAPNLTAMAYLYQSGGSNNGVKVQKVFAQGVRTAPFASVNSDKNMLYESFLCGNYAWSAKSLLATHFADLNGTIKNGDTPTGTTGQASVYGTHCLDTLYGTEYGRFQIMCNEPTTETATVFSSVVGTAKFNSSGGVIIPSVGDQHIWTTPHWVKCHTGFVPLELVMSGGTLANYNIHYQLDTGSGYSDWQNLYYTRAGGSGTSGQYTFTVTDATGVAVGDYCWGTGLSTLGTGSRYAAIPRVTQVNGNTITVNVANTGTVSGIIRFNHLPFETMDPAVGFKMKLRVTTMIANTTAITYMRMDTITTVAAQANYYPLDTLNVTLTGLVPGSDVVIRRHGTTDILGSVDQNPTSSWSFTYETPENVDILIYRSGFMPNTTLRNYMLPSSDSSLPITQTPDSSYVE